MKKVQNRAVLLTEAGETLGALTMGDIFLFVGFRLDRRGGSLFREADDSAPIPVAIGSRALDLLGLLVERQGALVTKNEIMGAVWPQTVVEDGNLTVQISGLRRILDQGRAGGSCIQTVAGRGYRFVGAVTVTGYDAGSRRVLPPLPDAPSIAVLPFRNMSGDPEQEYFVDGMVEEIITALSRIRWLFVIARNSTFTYKGRAVDVKQVGRELGVRYVLEGSVRKAGTRARLTAQLIDALTGTHLWADHFDGSLEDVFELQDKIALSVAGVIEPALQAAEMRRSAARPTTDLTAYDLYLRAVETFLPITKERIFAAVDLLEQAIAIDPHYGPALAWTAQCYMQIVVNGWASEAEAPRRRAVDLARRALQATQNDPGTLVYGARVLVHFGEDIDAMLGLVDRALALNPSFARGWNVSGVIRNFAGQPDLAIEHVETAMRLSPRERVGTSLHAMGMAHFFKHRFGEAEAKLLLAIQDDPGLAMPYRFLAACYAHMGRLDEARAVVAKLRTITPQVVPSDLPWRNAEDRELFLSSLRLAMGETE